MDEKQEKYNPLQVFKLVVEGILIGAGAILPGISGGVLSVAFGIYQPMMELLAHPFKALKKYYKLLIPVGIGVALGFVLFANVVEWLFNIAANVALMIFAGLIFGTMPKLLESTEEGEEKKSWVPFFLAIALAFVFFNAIASDSNITIEVNTMWYFIGGLIWGLSLVVPGLSSSSILIYIGVYEPMIAGIASLDFSVIIPLFAGILIVCLVSARGINALFEKHYSLFMRVVLGIMLASSILIIPTSYEGIVDLLLSIACFCISFWAAGKLS